LKEWIFYVMTIAIPVGFIFLEYILPRILKRRELVKHLLEIYRLEQEIVYIDPINLSTEKLEEMYEAAMDAIFVREWIEEVQEGEILFSKPIKEIESEYQRTLTK